MLQVQLVGRQELGRCPWECLKDLLGPDEGGQVRQGVDDQISRGRRGLLPRSPTLMDRHVFVLFNEIIHKDHFERYTRIV